MAEQAWLIRPKPHDHVRIKEFLSENIIAVGWPNIGDLSGLREHNLRELIANKYGENPSALATLKVMVYRMKIGDFVLVPYKGSNYFGKITSDYFYNASKDNDQEGYPHQRNVKWFNIILERSELPDNLKKSTRVVRTSAELTAYVDEIAEIVRKSDETLDNEDNGAQFSDDSEINACTKNSGNVEETLLEKAKFVLEEELANDDPLIRIRAAEVILNAKKFE